MERYMYFILCQRYNFLSRLYSIDIGKKLIIKYADKSTSIEDILTLWLRYISIKNGRNVTNYYDVYDFYNLEKPNKDKTSVACIRPITLLNAVAKLLEKMMLRTGC